MYVPHIPWKLAGFLLFAQRYLLIKNMTPEERKKVVKKVVFFAGKAAPACLFLSFLLHRRLLIVGSIQTTLRSS